MEKKQPHHQLKQIESLFSSSLNNTAGTTTNGNNNNINNNNHSIRSTKSPEVAILETDRDHNCDVHGDGHHHHHHQSNHRRGSSTQQGSLLRRDSSIGSSMQHQNGYANAINRKDSTAVISSGYGTVRMRKKDPTSVDREMTPVGLQRRQSFVAGTGTGNRKYSNVSDSAR